MPLAAGSNPSASREGFETHHAKRRQELWSLLGDLPWKHKPQPAKLIKTETHDGYTIH